MFSFKRNHTPIRWINKILALAISLLLIFLLIGHLTTMNPANRVSSNLISNWTSDIDGLIFLHLLAMENRSLMTFYEEENQFGNFAKTLFQFVTSIKPNDFRSLLGNELLGFSRFDREILIAGEGTDYTNLPVESTFPLEDVLEEREAVFEEEEKEDEEVEEEQVELKNAVFIYNTHNRESFLPHLPDGDKPDRAQHSEVNITKISERLKEDLAKKGIGAIVDDTDIIGEMLVERGWEYWQSYQASREVVTEAFQQHQELEFAFDLHRDGIAREHTTKEINGEDYARIMFVIGEDNPSFKENFQLAESLHHLLEEKYPGISRGVIPQGGASNNGIYNQDLSDNILLLEIGGVENTLEEAYRTMEAFAEAFSEYYWDAEAVQGRGD